MAGAKYIVSPAFNQETAIICNRYGIPYIPGCMTIKEIITAMEYGCEIIKLFPGSAFGPNYINAIKGPLPYVSLMVTGGVKLAAKGQFETIKEIAQKYVNTKTRK